MNHFSSGLNLLISGRVAQLNFLSIAIRASLAIEVKRQSGHNNGPLSCGVTGFGIDGDWTF